MHSLASLYLVVHRPAAALEPTFDSVATAIRNLNERVEVWVLDNLPSSDLAEDVKRHFCGVAEAVHYSRFEDNRKSVALNSVIHLSDTEYLAFADDDICVAPDWLERLLEPMAVGAAELVQGRVDLVPDRVLPWFESVHRSWLADTIEFGAQQRGDVIGASKAFHRKVLMQVRGYDPELGPGTELPFAEDTLFSLMAAKAGYRAVFAERSRAIHYPNLSRLTPISFYRQAQKLGASSAYVYHHWMHELPGPMMLGKAPLTESEVIGQEAVSEAALRHLYMFTLREELAKIAATPRNYRKYGLEKIGGEPLQFWNSSEGTLLKCGDD